MKLRKLSEKELLIAKIILTICMAVVMVHAVYILLKNFNSWPDNFYSRVFLLPIIIFTVGLVAYILPFVSYTKSYSTNAKADGIMVYVGIGAIILSIATFIFLISTRR